jgi:2-oxoglutarate ferredoxin oxidoreductase subunit alpha
MKSTGDVFTFMVGGKAGQGVKKAASAVSGLFASMGRHVFQMDDYQSLIRGGHNFSIVSTSLREITSQYGKADLIVALDRRSYDLHLGDLAEGGTLIRDSDEIPEGRGIGVPITTEAKAFPDAMLRSGLAGVVCLCALLGLSKDEMRELVRREYARDVENNIAFAERIYDSVSAATPRLALERGAQPRTLLTGFEAMGLGAAAGGLDVYLAYPMTPASPLLHYLAAHDQELGIVVVHPENEVAVANMAIGCTFAGARTMVGTSGGGFALMEEAFSLAGMAESPLLFFLGQRPGPSTGVPTYTSQADLRFALNQGHGEFARIVASPGSVEEAFRLTAEMLALVWRFQTPGILLSDKHLSEATVTSALAVDGAEWAAPLAHVDAAKGADAGTTAHSAGGYRRYLATKDGVSPMLFPPHREIIKWNSYEHDEFGITTEDALGIARMQEKRTRKIEAVEEYLEGRKTVNRYGSGGPTIFTYGSTTMSVLEALRVGGIEATVVQPIYLDPLPVWELEDYTDSYPIVVEQSLTGQFATLLEEKAGILPAVVIGRYDGRPFDPVDLAEKIGEHVGRGRDRSGVRRES